MSDKELDWEHALKELDYYENGGEWDLYGGISWFLEGCAKHFRERYDSGERTQKLYDLMTGDYDNVG